MSKHRRNSGTRQEFPSRTVTLEVPVALLSTLMDARNALFELCLETGQQTLMQLMEEDRTALCGPKDKHQADRRAYRHGYAPSEVTLGGRRIAMPRPRVRSADGAELALPTFQAAAARDPLDDHTMAAIVAGVSTRQYASTLEPLPPAVSERSTSRSSVSRRFVALTAAQMDRWLHQRIEDLGIRIVMIDGKVFRNHVVLIVLGIAENGRKYVLGLREGTTENATVCRALLSELIERGLPTDRRLLFIIDGGKGIRRGIRECFGREAVVQRCLTHKERNVVEHLPPSMHASVRAALKRAWKSTDVKLARRQLEQLARGLESKHAGAAASILEGLDEQLTLQRLGIDGTLARVLRTTNAIENLMGSVQRYTRNVKRWRGGKMILRWVGTAVLHAQRSFRGLHGQSDIPKLVRALQDVDLEDIAA